jgi:hypothetical protein
MLEDPARVAVPIVKVAVYVPAEVYVCKVENVAVGFTQFELPTFVAHRYCGMGFGLSVADVPSPKLKLSPTFEVKFTVSGAWPDVGLALKVTPEFEGGGFGF